MECFLGGGSMASALVIVLESTFCVPGFPPSTVIIPRDLEWGQWADRSTADCCRRSCVDQAAPSPASWDFLPPAFSPSVGTG